MDARPSWWYGDASGNPSPLIPPSLRARGAPVRRTDWASRYVFTEGATDGFGRNFTGVTASVIGSINLLANPAVFPRFESSSPFDGVPPGVFDYQVNNQDPAANIDLHYFLSREDRSWPQRFRHASITDCSFFKGATNRSGCHFCVPAYRTRWQASRRSPDRHSFGRRRAPSPGLPAALMPFIWMSRGCQANA